jgi:hypothetical protein
MTNVGDMRATMVGRNIIDRVVSEMTQRVALSIWPFKGNMFQA